MHQSFKRRIALLLATLATATIAAAQDRDWKQDWQVAKGFALEIDVRGLHLPSSIAFVPDPGDAPGDPLYFVNELRGQIKVVTNDRSVHVFAQEFFQLEVEEELPGMKGEAGLTGLCLEPTNGYVFVSFNYQDADGILRNSIVRFESEPRIFSTSAKGKTSFAHIFEDHLSAISHMIGPMAVRDGALFVAVGDAGSPRLSRTLGSPLGKILRMDLDGRPLPDNPFYSSDDARDPRNYVWALGLRNPFGLAFAGDTLCASDNGPGVDRFVTIRKGRDYLYDGSNWSIGTNADVVFSPSVGPVQMVFLPGGPGPFPEEYRSRFYLALAGFVQQRPGPGPRGERSVVTIPYDPSAGRVTAAPEALVQYVGPDRQMPCGLAFGPDGLYIAPLFPVVDQSAAILKLRFAPTREHAKILGQSPLPLMTANGCLGCHSFDSHKDHGVGPTLERDVLIARLMERLHSDDYLRRLDAVDAIQTEPFPTYRKARDEVRATSGMARLRTWMKYQIVEPRFDDPNSQMPNLGLDQEQATLIADSLLSVSNDSPEPGLFERARLYMVQLIPKPRQRHLLMFLAIGLAAGVLLTLSAGALARWRRKRRSSGAASARGL